MKAPSSCESSQSSFDKTPAASSMGSPRPCHFDFSTPAPPFPLMNFWKELRHTPKKNIGEGACTTMICPRTKYLSVRVTQKFDEFLKTVADEFGVSKSRYARVVLADDLKRHKARRHLLGLDRPKALHSHI